MNQCWKKLGGKFEEEVLEKYKVDDSKRGAYKGRACWNGGVCEKAGSTKHESGERTVGQAFALFKEYNLQRLKSICDYLTEGEEMKRQQRMMIHVGYDERKIRSRARVDDCTGRWVTEYLEADCEKAWLHPGNEEFMQKWFVWSENFKKRLRREEWNNCTCKGCIR